MSQSAMDRVLNYPALPSLPGVATRVLDLTRSPKVSMQEIAQTVVMDPALATKVLKTVNSSYYALAQPCPSIPRAMSMLGMSTVKSIVLGFSLVEMTKAVAGSAQTFDLQAYWRRAVFASVAARSLATRFGKCDPEDAFTGSMIADIGMLACFAALKDEYTTVLAAAPDDHAQVIAIEQQSLGFDHTQIGCRLAQKWRLPEQLQECVAYQHDPQSCHPQHEWLLKCVGLGQVAAGVLSMRDSKSKLGAYVVGCRDWYGLDRKGADDLLESVCKGAAELAKSLELKTGERPDLPAILAQAQDALIESQQQAHQAEAQLRKANEELSRKSITDALTGAFNRAHFDAELARAYAEAERTKSPLSLLFFDADAFKSVNDTCGHQAGDEVLKELSRRTRTLLSGLGVVCRYGGEEFAVILPRVGLVKAAKIAELLRSVIAKAPMDLTVVGIAEPRPVTVSIGVSSFDPTLPRAAATAATLTRIADECVYAAKRAGRNRVCAMTPAGAPGPAPEPATTVGLIASARAA